MQICKQFVSINEENKIKAELFFFLKKKKSLNRIRCDKGEFEKINYDNSSLWSVYGSSPQPNYHYSSFSLSKFSSFFS